MDRAGSVLTSVMDNKRASTSRFSIKEGERTASRFSGLNQIAKTPRIEDINGVGDINAVSGGLFDGLPSVGSDLTGGIPSDFNLDADYVANLN